MVDGTQTIIDAITLTLYRGSVLAYTSIKQAYCACSRLLNAGAAFHVRLLIDAPAWLKKHSI